MNAKSINRILIVDDERNIRIVLRTVLEAAGYAVEEAADGAAAIQRADVGGVDLIILDLNMPIVNGKAVLERLGQREGPKPRVIVLTAHGSITAAVTAVRLGASDFLQKPVLPSDLLSSVAAVLAEPLATPALLNDAAEDLSDVIQEVRSHIWHKDLKHAERLMNQIAEKATTNPEYFNLLGVIHEAEGNCRAARTFYRKAAALACAYEPALNNSQRLHELETYGHSKVDVALGDEEELLRGFRGVLGGNHLGRIRNLLENLKRE